MEVKQKNETKYCVVNDFPEKGVRFIDFTPTIMDSLSFLLTACEMSALLKEKEVGYFDYIIAPEARGFIWGTILSYKLMTPLIIARKRGKIPTSLVGQGVEYKTEYSTDYLEIHDIDLKDKRVLYVDDVYATGGTYEVCKKLVEKAGGTITNGLVLYNVGINENDEIISLYGGTDL